MKAGNVAIIAPDRFMEEVTKENVLAGTPMIRRAMFQFGATAAQGPARPGRRRPRQGHLARHRHADPADADHQASRSRRTRIDGVEIVFQLAPDTEAPAEMHMFYPGLRALNLAENATHNLHNIYPIRGAQVRDANAWAKYLNEARDRFATKADVVFAQHHWPVWGNARVLDYLGQAARHLQVPARPDPAAHEPRPSRRPRSPSGWRCRRASRRTWHVRGYYGTLQPQRQGRLPALSRLVRRQSRQPQSAAAGRARRRSTWSTWAAPRRRSRARARTSPRASTAWWPRP